MHIAKSTQSAKVTVALQFHGRKAEATEVGRKPLLSATGEGGRMNEWQAEDT